MPAALAARSSLPALVGALVGIVLACSPVGGAHAVPAPRSAPKVQFVGNASVSSKQLLAALSKFPLFDAAGTIDEDILERALLELAVFYWDRGHAMVKILPPVISPSREAVTFSIEEGSVFTLRSVTATGELIGSAEANLGVIRARAGVRFSRTMLANDREALSDFYQDQGYAFVNIFPLTKVDLDRKTIGLTFEVQRGKRAHIERIEIDGSPKAVQEVRRALRIAEGDLFTNRELVDGKSRLRALGLGEVVIATKQGSSDELVVLVIEVP